MRQRLTGWWGIPVALVAILGLGGFALREGTANHPNPAVGDPLAPWTTHVQKVDEALAERDASAAAQAWHEAYMNALGSRRWEGMIEVGDAYLRVGQLSASRQAVEAKARHLYLAALFRARAQDSLDGILRAAEAFADLGDREVATQCIRIADDLSARDRDPQARERVRAFTDRLTGRLLASELAAQF